MPDVYYYYHYQYYYCHIIVIIPLQRRDGSILKINSNHLQYIQSPFTQL